MKKKLFSGLLALAMSLTAVSMPTGGFGVQTAQTAYADEADVIEISTRAQLEALAGKSGSYRLTADIDLAGKDWTPIEGFKGSFDGGGHAIKNMTISGTQSSNRYGLFSSLVSGSVIESLRLENVDISATSANNIECGAFAGNSSATVKNCSVTGKLEAAINKKYTNFIGGIVGYSGSGAVEYCYNAAEVRCDAPEDETKYLYLGGIAGTCQTVRFSYNRGDVISNSVYTGGITGKFSSSASTEMSYCYSINSGLFGRGADAPKYNSSNYQPMDVGNELIGWGGTGIQEHDLRNNFDRYVNFSTAVWDFLPGFGPQLRTNPQIVIKAEDMKLDASPTKTEYTVGETFDPSGAVIEATYKDAHSRAELGKGYIPVTSDMTSGISLGYSKENVGDKSFKIAWHGATMTTGNIIKVKGIPTDSVAFEYPEFELELDSSGYDNACLEVIFDPVEATDWIVSCQSSNEAVCQAFVYDDNYIVVYSEKPGNATVTVTTANGKTASCDITVLAPVYNIYLLGSMNMYVGQTARLPYVTEPAETTDKITWTSDDETVCTVDENGNVIAVGAGTAKVTATADSGAYDYSHITVSAAAKPATDISLAVYSDMTMKIGDVKYIWYDLTPSDSTDTVTWKSLNPSVCTVDIDGTVTAVGKGSTTVIAETSSGMSASCNVKVVKPITKVEFNPYYVYIPRGKDRQLNYTIVTEDYDKDDYLVFESNDSSNVSVKSGGIAHAYKINLQATIWAKSHLTGETVGYCRVYGVDGEVAATAITLDKHEITLYTGDTMALDYKLYPKDATSIVSWTSDDPEICSVAEGGFITAEKAGTAYITAEVDGHSDMVEVEVIERPTAVSFEEEAITLTVGDEKDISAILTPDGAADAFKWYSSNEAVCGILSYGGPCKLYAKNPGTATITVETETHHLMATLEVTVVPAKVPAEYIVFEGKDEGFDYYMTVGKTFALPYKVLPASSDDKIAWSSDNEEVCTVDNGVVSAVNIGMATITATAESGVSASVTVYVEPAPEIPATFITLNKTTLNMTVGGEDTLIATMLPEDNTDHITWSSSAPSICSVVNGKLTALSAGKATITATTVSDLTATCEVTVSPLLIPSELITLDRTTLGLKVGGTAELNCSMLPANSTDTVSWSTSNADVCTVTNGKLVAKAVGTADITVTTASGKTAVCSVTVTAEEIPSTSVTLDKASLNMKVGEKQTLTCSILPENSTDSVTWTSSAPEVCTVENGVLTALAEGSAAVIVTTESGKTAACVVTVTLPDPSDIPAESISLSETSVEIKAGESITLTCSILPENSTDSVIWISSEPEICEADNGKITALTEGLATVIAMTSSGKTAFCAVKVLPADIPAESVALDRSKAEMTVGDTLTLSCTVLPADTTDELTWSTSNSSVCKVENGKLTALAAGNAVVTVTSSSGKTATCSVTVTAKQTSDPNSSDSGASDTDNSNSDTSKPDSSDLNTSDTSTSASTSENNSDASDSNSGNSNTSDTSDNTSKPDTSDPDTSDKPETPVSEIKLSKTTLELYKGKTFTLTATLDPESSDEKITWTSDNDKVCEVNGEGVLKGIKAGTANITAKTESGKTAVCKVTVKEIKAKSIKLNKKTLKLNKGKTFRLKATLDPKNSTDTVKWTSSDKKICKVSSEGVLTGVKAGKATITAKTEDGKKAVCKVTVKAIKSKSVKLNKKALKLKKGKSFKLKATLKPKNSTDTLKWTTSNKKVCTVSKNGLVKGKKKGKANITVKTESGKKAVCKVTVS